MCGYVSVCVSFAISFAMTNTTAAAGIDVADIAITNATTITAAITITVL